MHSPKDFARSHSRRSLLQAGATVTAGVGLGVGLPRLAGASGTSTSRSRGSAKAQDVTTLRLQNWFSESDMDDWQIGIDMVKELHPDIEVAREFVPYGETVTKTLVAAAADSMPDVIMASTDHTPALATNGLLLDLNSYIEADGDVNTDDFALGVAQGFNMWDRWWGFPYDVSTWAIYYNKDMFDAAGVAYPPGSGGTGWTWDEFVEAAKALTVGDGEQWGVVWGSPPWNEYLNANFIYSAGGRVFDDERRTSIINSPETAAGLQFMIDLIHTHKVAPTPEEIAGGDVDYFTSGLAAMSLNGQWALGRTNTDADFAFDIGYLPLGPEQKVVTGGSGFTISSTTENADAAWRWLKAFTSTEVLAAMIGGTGRGIPARLSATQSYVDSAEGVEFASVFVEQLEYSFNDRSVIAYTEYADSYARALEPIYNSGDGDLAAALATIQDETNAALDEKWQDVKIEI